MAPFSADDAPQQGCRIVLHKLVKPGGHPSSRVIPAATATRVAPFDAFALLRQTACSWGFQGARFDADVLELALQACLDDLPVFAGRCVADERGSRQQDVQFGGGDHPGVMSGDAHTLIRQAGAERTLATHWLRPGHHLQTTVSMLIPPPHTYTNALHQPLDEGCFPG
jgi:hypothetical protein